MKPKFVPISDKLSIPVPPGLTPEQEAEYVERYKAQFNWEEFEKEYKEWEELVALEREGKTIPFEVVLKELFKDDPDPPKGAP